MSTPAFSFALSRTRRQLLTLAVLPLFLALAASLALLPGAARAAEESPDALVRSLSEEMLKTIRADPGLRSGDMRRIMALVDAKVMPNVNFQRMTALAVGPSWRQASPEQRKRLQEEFKTLLVRTYAGALTQIQDETVVVRPVRLSPGDTEVVVRTEIRGRGDPIQLDYRLEKTPGEGAGWKIFNLNVLGVWLVETYRSQFAQEINARGLDGLVNALTERNRTVGNRPRN
jgi:phospholipid transport system substrate-binding protein